MDISHNLQEQLQDMLSNQQPVAISAGNSKDFYGREIKGEPLSVADHAGVVDYDFRELVITARSGTRLEELQKILADNNQMLAFEPPVYSGNDTIGGLLACGLSGPRRPYVGSARDFVLGCTVLNGKAEKLKFGGQVMKNVAGYDVSRLMVGAMGTLGVLLDVSLKVLPKPEVEKTLIIELPLNDALQYMNQLETQRLPLSATAYLDNKLYLRLSGLEKPVENHLKNINASSVEDGTDFWQNLKDHRLEFFNSDKTLWRISVPPAKGVLDLNGKILYEWRGAQRWFIADDVNQSADDVMSVAKQAGGHAIQFRNGDRGLDVFSPLPEVLKKYHIKLKHAMDPNGLLNPGRFYSYF